MSPRHPKTRSMDLVLTYDEEGNIVFAERETLRTVAYQQHVIDTSKTWGEFVRNADDELLESAVMQFQDDLIPPPWKDDERFDASKHLPAYLEGLIPAWPMGEMASFVPRKLLAKYCVEGESSMSGSYAWVPERNVLPLADALRALGHTVDTDGFVPDPSDADEDEDA